MMDMQSFRRYAAIYGGDLSRWPVELLPAAAQTLKTIAAAEQVLAQESMLDTALAELPPVAASDPLRAKIRAIPHNVAFFLPPLALPLWLRPSRLVPALALCGLLGLLVGANDPIQQVQTQHAQENWALAPEQTTSLY